MQISIKHHISFTEQRDFSNDIWKLCRVAQLQFQVEINKSSLASERDRALFSVVGGISVRLEAPANQESDFAERKRKRLTADHASEALVRVLRLRSVEQGSP